MQATTDGVEGRAMVQIVAKLAAGTSTGPVRGPGQATLKWNGAIPPQKWTNFYTKVLARFANTPGLKISVSFSVPADEQQSKSKADEARSALKELGLDDSVAMD